MRVADRRSAGDHLAQQRSDCGIDLSQPLPVPPPAGLEPPPYYDVNGDSFVSPIDALLVIGRLNGDIPADGESGSYQTAVASAPDLLEDQSPDNGLLVDPLVTSSQGVASEVSTLSTSTWNTAEGEAATEPVYTGTAAKRTASPLDVAIQVDYQNETLDDLLAGVAEDDQDLVARDDAHDKFFASLDA